MDIEAVASELYGLDPDDFVPARTAAVTHARAAKDRPLATALGALKRPTRSAWLVNLLARDTSIELDRLGELAEQLARAHHGADLAAVRRLSAERQKLVDTLTRQAVAAGAERGYAATEAVRLEVSGTLSAAVADPEALSEVLAGRVVRARVYSGFGFPLGPTLAAAAAAQAEPPASQEPTPAKATPETEKAQQARRQAQAALETATEALVEARGALKAAETAETAAVERLDQASKEVADLRTELRAAEASEVAARRGSTEAADDLHEARGTLQQAEAALAAAARVLGAPAD